MESAIHRSSPVKLEVEGFRSLHSTSLQLWLLVSIMLCLYFSCHLISKIICALIILIILSPSGGIMQMLY